MPGIKTWAVGEEVLAADFNSFVQTQVVARFASVAARDAAWPAATAGVGAVCTTIDTGTLWNVVPGPPVAWAPTETPGFVTTFVPVINQPANVAKNVTKSQWHYDGDMVEFECELAITASGIAGGALSVTLPVPAFAATNSCIGVGYYYDSAPTPGTYVCIAATVAAGSVQFLPDGQPGNYWGITPSLAAGAGDTLRFLIRYRWR